MSDRTRTARLAITHSHRSTRPQGQRRLGLELLEDRLAPATLMVNSTADTASDSDAYLSLREAIAIVNSSTLPTDLTQQIQGQISGTLHANGSDTIGFDATAVTGPITLGQPDASDLAGRDRGRHHRRRFRWSDSERQRAE
jgi:hypothetical protein